MTDDDHFRGHVTQKAVVFGPDGRVLLVRSSDRSWVIPGGRLENDERAEAGLERELHEETGLSVSVSRPVLTATGLWYTDDGQPMFTVVYGAEADSRDVVLNHEHDEYAWVSPTEATERFVAEALAVAVERASQHRDFINGSGSLLNYTPKSVVYLRAGRSRAGQSNRA